MLTDPEIVPLLTLRTGVRVVYAGARRAAVACEKASLCCAFPEPAGLAARSLEQIETARSRDLIMRRPCANRR